MAQCPHGNTIPDQVILLLGESQAGEARHKCAICAYARGTEYSGSPRAVEQCGHDNVAPIELLKRLPNYQGGPTRHLCATCAYTHGVARGAAYAGIEVEDNLAGNTPPDEHGGAIEGTVSMRWHKDYERDQRNRAKAILYHGTKCLGCGFFFDATYTAQHANGYIEIHHVRPLADGPQFVDPTRDLIPLCANCHRMVHRRRGESLDLNQLHRLLEEARQGQG